MGLLDSVIGALGQTQAGAASAQPDLLQVVLGMLTSGQGSGSGALGGLAGLVQQLQQAGLGDIVNSWVSAGQNLPVAPDQLGRALGEDAVAALAGQLGQSSNDLLGQLSQLLPQVVDKLTPNGQLPQAQPGGMAELAAMLGGSLGPR